MSRCACYNPNSITSICCGCVVQQTVQQMEVTEFGLMWWCWKVDGHLVFTFDVSSGLQRVAEMSRTFNDGQYHYVQFIRTGSTATLRVDDLPPKRVDSSHSGLPSALIQVILRHSVLIVIRSYHLSSVDIFIVRLIYSLLKLTAAAAATGVAFCVCMLYTLLLICLTGQFCGATPD